MPSASKHALPEDVLIHEALLDRRRQRLSLPWERGINGLIFGFRPQPAPVLPIPSTLIPCDSLVKPNLSALPTATQTFAVQRARLAKLVQSDDAVRFEALRKIKVMTLLDPEASDLGKALAAEAATLSDDSQMVKSFQDTFSGKSTATLSKRAGAFWRFFEFCLANGLGSPLKANEKAVYAYVQHLQVHGAPTSGLSFVESWSFFSAFLGFRKNPQETPISGRVKGAISGMLGQKRKLVQASPLTVQMVKALEKIVHKPPMKHWRIIAGHILFCVGSSARFSDTIHLDSLECHVEDNVCLIEAASCSYKTGTGERKNVLLPMLSLGKFILDNPWGPLWVQARLDEGLSLHPSLPAFSEAGQAWLSRRMTTGELTLYLREFVQGSGLALAPNDKTSSHSLKCTVLSWLSKIGGVSLEDRRIAGHHLDPGAQSALTYSRDELCRMMKTEELILQKIRKGTFRPDDSRIMRLVSMIKSDDSANLQEWTLDGDPSFPQSEEGESDCEASTLEARSGGVQLASLSASQITSVYSKMHFYSRTVHIEASTGNKFLCGRSVTKNFVEVDSSVPASDLLVCKGCSQAYVATS